MSYSFEVESDQVYISPPKKNRELFNQDTESVNDGSKNFQKVTIFYNDEICTRSEGLP